MRLIFILLASSALAQVPAVDWKKQEAEVLKHYRSLVQINTSSPPGNETAADDYLKKVFDKRQQELDGKQTELSHAREDIEKQSRFLSREALQKRMEDWQRRMVELQTVFVDYNKELQKKQGEKQAAA